MNLEPGTRLGRYEIKSLLGAGGMGEVYLASDAELRRAVALKFLPAEVAADPKRLERFEREALTASALNHPHILTVYDIGQTADGRRFFATEFVEGATLREHVKARRPKLGEVLEVAAQIAGALVEAHAHGIVHRDIKPENVMVRRDGYVKVLDFGLAKLTGGPSGVDTEAATRALAITDAGAVTRVTNDLTQYGAMSFTMTADSSTIATLVSEQSSKLWLAAPNEEEGRARKLTDGKEDGLAGLDWTPDGRIVYVAKTGDHRNIWTRPLEGGTPRQLTRFTSERILNFAPSRDGRQFAVARGTYSADIILIKDFR